MRCTGYAPLPGSGMGPVLAADYQMLVDIVYFAEACEIFFQSFGVPVGACVFLPRSVSSGVKEKGKSQPPFPYFVSLSS